MTAFYSSTEDMLAAAVATMRNLAIIHSASHGKIIHNVYHSATKHLSGIYPVWIFSLETPEGIQIDTRRFAINAMHLGGHFLSRHLATKFARTVRYELAKILGPELASGGWLAYESITTQSPRGWTVADTANEDMQDAAAPATPHADETEECEQVELDFGMPALFTRIQCASLAIRDGDIITHSPAIVGIREDGSKRVFVNWEVTFSDPENGERDAIAFASSEIGLRLEAEWDHATSMQEETGVFFISAERMLANLTSEWS